MTRGDEVGRCGAKESLPVGLESQSTHCIDVRFGNGRSITHRSGSKVRGGAGTSLMRHPVETGLQKLNIRRVVRLFDR